MALPTATCPACKIALPAGATTCPDCGEDLLPLLRLQLDPHLRFNKALQLARQGDLDAALLAMHQVREALPDEPAPYVVLGKLYAQKGDAAQARRWWQKALERWPDEGNAREGLAALGAAEAAAAEVHAQAEARAQKEARRARRNDAVRFAGLGASAVAALAVVLALIALPRWPRAAETPPAVAMSTMTREEGRTEPAPAPTQTPAPTPMQEPTPTPEPTRQPTPTQEPSPTPTQQPTPAPTQPPTPTPAPTPDLAGSLLAALRADPRLAGLGIDIGQDAGGLRLAGEVPSLLLKYRIEAMAAALPARGDLSVDVTGLQVVHVVAAGDTLSQIALAVYGDATAWPVIADANRLADPRSIRPGDHLIIPPLP